MIWLQCINTRARGKMHDYVFMVKAVDYMIHSVLLFVQDGLLLSRTE
jgi:hypothetical protein